jgi:hypothetical protein
MHVFPFPIIVLYISEILISLCNLPLLLEDDAFDQILFLLEKCVVNLVLFHPAKIKNISSILHFCIKT